MKKTILLTGSSGFVGSYFKQHHSADFEIQCVSLRETAPEEISFRNIDCVLHCAALVHQMKGAPESEYFKINFELTKKLADQAKSSGIKHFIFLSTAHVFGDSGDLYNHNRRLNEDSLCNPKDAYGKSKLAAEQYLQSIQSPDFIVSIIRPPMVYGKGAKGNIVTLAKLIKMIPILPLRYTENRRSIVYVGNLCQLIALIIQNEVNGILLPQDNTPVSIADLTEDIAYALGKRRLFFALPNVIMKFLFKAAPKISIRLFGTLAMDSTQTNARTNYTPLLTSREGLTEMFS